MVFESSTVFPDPENPEDSESFAGILDNKKLLGALSLFPPVMGQDSCYLGYTDVHGHGVANFPATIRLLADIWIEFG